MNQSLIRFWSSYSTRYPWISFCGALLLWKITFFLALYMAVYLLPPIFNFEFYNQNFPWVKENRLTLLTFVRTWDARHYLSIADRGYPPFHHPTTAFFPLYPGLIFFLSLFSGGNTVLAGLLVSGVCSILGAYLLYEIVRKRFDETTARSAILLLCAFPGTIFFSLIYAESLLFLLLVILVHGMERRNFKEIAASAFLLPLTKAAGLFAVLPILTYAIRSGQKKNLLLLAYPLLGFAAYLLIMWQASGDAFSGLSAQKEFFVGQASVATLFDVPRFLGKLFHLQALHDIDGSLIDRIIFVWYCLGLITLLLKKEFELLFLALPFGMVPAFSLGLMSFTRYVSVVFPLFVVTATLSNTEKHPRVFWSIVVLSLLTQYLFLIRHINALWAG